MPHLLSPPLILCCPHCGVAIAPVLSGGVWHYEHPSTRVNPGCTEAGKRYATVQGCAVEVVEVETRLPLEVVA